MQTHVLGICGALALTKSQSLTFISFNCCVAFRCLKDITGFPFWSTPLAIRGHKSKHSLWSTLLNQKQLGVKLDCLWSWAPLPCQLPLWVYMQTHALEFSRALTLTKCCVIDCFLISLDTWAIFIVLRKHHHLSFWNTKSPILGQQIYPYWILGLGRMSYLCLVNYLMPNWMLKHKLEDAQTAKELSQKAQVASSPSFTDTEVCLAHKDTSEEIIHKNLLVLVVERKRERDTTSVALNLLEVRSVS